MQANHQRMHVSGFKSNMDCLIIGGDRVRAYHGRRVRLTNCRLANIGGKTTVVWETLPSIMSVTGAPFVFEEHQLMPLQDVNVGRSLAAEALKEMSEKKGKNLLRRTSDW